VLEALNKPGVLAAISGFMAGCGVNILSGSIWAEPGEEKAIWVSFVDLTGTGLSPRALADELEELDVVLKAKVVGLRLGDLVIDTFSFPTKFLARRVVLFDIDAVAAMLDWIDRTFGTGGHAILYEMGHQAGRTVVRTLKEKFNLPGPAAFEAFLAFGTAMGWFKYDIPSLELDPPRAIVRLYGSYECAPFRGSSGGSRSHLIRGLLAGAFEEALGVQATVRETLCLAKGDEFCEFVIEAVKLEGTGA